MQDLQPVVLPAMSRFAERLPQITCTAYTFQNGYRCKNVVTCSPVEDNMKDFGLTGPDMLQLEVSAKDEDGPYHQKTTVHWGTDLKKDHDVYVKWGIGKQRCNKLSQEARLYNRRLKKLQESIVPKLYGYFENDEGTFGVSFFKLCEIDRSKTRIKRLAPW